MYIPRPKIDVDTFQEFKQVLLGLHAYDCLIMAKIGHSMVCCHHHALNYFLTVTKNYCRRVSSCKRPFVRLPAFLVLSRVLFVTSV